MSRVAVINTVSPESGSASTGAIRSLFGAFRSSELVFVHPTGPDSPDLCHVVTHDRRMRARDCTDLSTQLAACEVTAIYSRAAEHPVKFWSLGERTAASLGVPHHLQIFDDVVAWQYDLGGPRGRVRAARRRVCLDSEIRSAASVLVCSDEANERLVFGRNPTVHRYVMGVDRASYARPEPSSELRLGYGGRCSALQHVEGFQLVLEAIIELNADSHPVRLACAGPRRSEFVEMFASVPGARQFAEHCGDLTSSEQRRDFRESIDAMVVTTNLSESQSSYSWTSMSSKALEMVGTNIPTLVVGGASQATVAWAANTKWAKTAQTREGVRNALLEIHADPTLASSEVAARERLMRSWGQEVVENEIRRILLQET